MSTFILVHGAWHGGWVWDRVAQQLKRSGHNVLAPDLPAHGSDRTPVGQVTLQRYVDKIVNLVDACAQPVVLAGHSMGGIVLSQAAEQRPERIRVLVYICAFMLRNGQTLLEVAQADKDALVMPNVIPSPDGSSANLQPEMLREMFYGTCSDNDYEFAKSRLVPQPTAPFGTPLHLSEANFGRVPRLYIECLRDRAITIACQREMQARAGRDRVETLDCDHSPFFSATDELVKFLLSADGMSIRGNASIRHQGAPH
jgi:pimeloyl-ACP methyl ester carboxylesterase